LPSRGTKPSTCYTTSRHGATRQVTRLHAPRAVARILPCRLITDSFIPAQLNMSVARSARAQGRDARQTLRFCDRPRDAGNSGQRPTARAVAVGNRRPGVIAAPQRARTHNLTGHRAAPKLLCPLRALDVRAVAALARPGRPRSTFSSTAPGVRPSRHVLEFSRRTGISPSTRKAKAMQRTSGLSAGPCWRAGSGSIFNVASGASSVAASPTGDVYGRFPGMPGIRLTRSVAADFIKQGMRCTHLPGHDREPLARRPHQRSRPSNTARHRGDRQSLHRTARRWASLQGPRRSPLWRSPWLPRKAPTPPSADPPRLRRFALD